MTHSSYSQEDEMPAETAPAHRGSRFTPSEREAMILENVATIKYVVHRVGSRLPAHVDREDLIQSGIIGLIDAIEKFEPERGIKFKTYAELRIRGAILDSLREIDWVPRNLRKKSRELQRACADVEQEQGRPATDQEIADRIGISLDDFHKLLDDLKGIHIGSVHTSSVTTSDGEDVETVLYSLEAPDESSPTVQLEKNELRRVLGAAIDLLPANEKLVVSLYYYDELTMKEIAAVLDVNESRVSQIHTKAMLRLRGKLSAKADSRN